MESSIGMTQTTGIAHRILIVEDEGIVANHIESLLEKAGYEVAGIAASSAEVFANIRERVPDLILMDIHIDGPVDGIQTAVKILENFNIPIIYLSAYTDQQTMDRARATGSFEFLSKPVNWGKLSAAVDGTLKKHRAAQALRVPA